MDCQEVEPIQENVLELVQKEKYGKKWGLKSNLTKFYGLDSYQAMCMVHLIHTSLVSWIQKKVRLPI